MGSLGGRRTGSDRARAIVRDEEAAIDDLRRVGR
jgi:hypothetical protein